MARYTRNTIILAKLEAVVGTPETPTITSNAILVRDCSINPIKSEAVNRDLIRGHFGASEMLFGTSSIEVSFSVELAGSGATATAPAWAPLVQACGFSQTAVGSSAGFEFNPVSIFVGGSSSLTIFYYLDGQLHKLLGARGTFSIDMGIGSIPQMKFTFTGLDGGITTASNPTTNSTTFSSFKTPKVVTNSNSGDVMIGALTYTTSTGVVAGGTSYNSRGISLDIGNNVVFQPMLGTQSVEIAQREVTGSISLDLTAENAVTFFAAIKSDATTGFGFIHGSGAGNVIQIYAPKVQRMDASIEEMNAQSLHSFKLRMTTSAGNDEIKITVR